MVALIGYLAAFLTTCSVIPQIVHTLRTRDVRGVSIPSWCALATGIALWLVYGIFIGSGPVIASNAFSLLLDLIVITLALIWRNNHAGEPAPRETITINPIPGSGI